MSESSSEDENSDRLKEAVWSFGPQDVKIHGNGGASCPYYADNSSSRRSHRTDVSKHEHDGNELGTTPEFQCHVAKKLGAFLDGCISEVFSGAVDSKPDLSKNRDEEDEESFRLFSTSAPGNWMEEPLPPPPKRRPIPSSSDSDSEMEMRFREAAVCVSDILSSAAQHLTEEKHVTKESVTAEEGTVSKKKKKKKKRKASTERSEENITHDVSEKQSNGEGTEDQTTEVENLTKKKKKKKKRIKLEEGRKDCDE